MELPINQILNGDALTHLRELPEKSINMLMTSPPYWALRDYGEGTETIWDGVVGCEHDFISKDRKIHSGTTKSKISGDNSGHLNEKSITDNFCKKCGAWKGQLGLEPTFDLYISHLCDIFEEFKRVLRDDGTCWVNLGDTYGGTGAGQEKNMDAKGKQTAGQYELSSKARDLKSKNTKYLSKCLISIPARFQLEMVNRGWILRNVIIWYKPNCMPSSVKDRFTVDFEYIFFFSKKKKYYFETQYEPYEGKMNRWGGEKLKATKKSDLDEGTGQTTYRDRDMRPNKQGRNKRTVWSFGSKYDGTEGHSNRAGMQREPTLREKRMHEVIQKNIANYLKRYLTKEKRLILDDEFGKHKWTHWIRTDESGASLPSPNDWIKMKEILNFNDEYDDIMTETEVYLDDGMMWKNKGKNMRTTWKICPKPFKEAHFAVYPEELCETPIKAGCPEFVCVKCGKPKVLDVEYKRKQTRPAKESKYSDDVYVNSNRPMGLAKRIMATPEFKGYKPTCNCNAGFRGGIVLDPFFGSGTTGLVALKQGKNFIGIELNPEYIEIAKRRLKPFLEQKRLV